MKKNKKVLITGITGQDGIFLSKELVENDDLYNIFFRLRNAVEISN